MVTYFAKETATSEKRVFFRFRPSRHITASGSATATSTLSQKHANDIAKQIAREVSDSALDNNVNIMQLAIDLATVGETNFGLESLFLKDFIENIGDNRFVLHKSFSIPERFSLNINENETLTINQGVEIKTARGKFNNNGNCIVEGTLVLGNTNFSKKNINKTNPLGQHQLNNSNLSKEQKLHNTIKNNILNQPAITQNTSDPEVATMASDNMASATMASATMASASSGSGAQIETATNTGNIISYDSGINTGTITFSQNSNGIIDTGYFYGNNGNITVESSAYLEVNGTLTNGTPGTITVLTDGTISNNYVVNDYGITTSSSGNILNNTNCRWNWYLTTYALTKYGDVNDDGLFINMPGAEIPAFATLNINNLMFRIQPGNNYVFYTFINYGTIINNGTFYILQQNTFINAGTFYNNVGGNGVTNSLGVYNNGGIFNNTGVFNNATSGYIFNATSSTINSGTLLDYGTLYIYNNYVNITNTSTASWCVFLTSKSVSNYCSNDRKGNYTLKESLSTQTFSETGYITCLVISEGETLTNPNSFVITNTGYTYNLVNNNLQLNNNLFFSIINAGIIYDYGTTIATNNGIIENIVAPATSTGIWNIYPTSDLIINNPVCSYNTTNSTLTLTYVNTTNYRLILSNFSTLNLSKSNILIINSNVQFNYSNLMNDGIITNYGLVLDLGSYSGNGEIENYANWCITLYSSLINSNLNTTSNNGITTFTLNNNFTLSKNSIFNSLYIYDNQEFIIPSSINFTIQLLFSVLIVNANIVNNGTFTNNGYISIISSSSNTPYYINNYGTLTNNSVINFNSYTSFNNYNIFTNNDLGIISFQIATLSLFTSSAYTNYGNVVINNSSNFLISSNSSFTNYNDSKFQITNSVFENNSQAVYTNVQYDSNTTLYGENSCSGNQSTNGIISQTFDNTVSTFKPNLINNGFIYGTVSLI